MNKYVHGYSAYEANRLHAQADSLADLLHSDSVWDEGSIILEAGCGIGAQTKIIAPKNRKSRFFAIDIASESLKQAKKVAEAKNIDNVVFQEADIFQLPFEDEHFDHIFLSYLLEHIPNPIRALNKLKRVLKKNGNITVIEGDHGSAYFHPDSELANKAIQCQVKLQKKNGGDANIGRKLYPLLEEAKFGKITVSARQVYVDDSNPDLVEGFTRNTFTAMINGISEEAISMKLMNSKEFEQGVRDL
ncbi:MAG: SAM-dependent methyltransferase [Candidatus Marinimicrobia bacterium]|nr:SAM-dependent methyltransferase [Candidatus Neomarinimicrobiota bacterium]|tara:strand:- start:8308 stop:9045 length:738 start_codon:yes stop_codon:yes gene_type:complete